MFKSVMMFPLLNLCCLTSDNRVYLNLATEWAANAGNWSPSQAVGGNRIVMTAVC
jgi:hypothetical protein